MADDDRIDIDFGDSDADGPDFAAPGGTGRPAPAPADPESDAAPSPTPQTPQPEPDADLPNGSVAATQSPEIMPIREEPEETEAPLFDWLTEVAIPVSIFGLLGCLLYYLIELRQALGGEFSSGLRWVCFWFLLAAILITRMRTKYGDQTVALPYIIALAATVVLFILRFSMTAGAIADRFTASGMLFSVGFNLALVAVTWWLADKVTREATLEDNVEYSLNQGFLTELGEQAPDQTKTAVTHRHPARIVFWVSVGAVLMFGLGTRAMGDDSRYAAEAFRLMGAYVFFALLLLALTNLSAIRMDVHRRGVRMGWGLVPTWIGMSLAIVLAIVLVAALLPRPRTDTGRPFSMGNRAAWLHDPGRGLGDGVPAAGISEQESEHTTSPGRDPETTGEGVPTNSGETGESGSSTQRPSDGAQGEQGSAGAQAGSAGRPSEQSAEGGGQSQGEGAGGEGGSGQEGDEGQAASQQSGQNPRFNWLLLLLLLLLLAIILFLLIKYRRQIWAALRTLAGPFRVLWAAILALLERLRKMLGFRPRPAFDEFADLPEDPFADIWEQRELGSNMTPAQIVRHVYRAFLAFCSLRGHPRADHQTELEFLRTVPDRIGLPSPDQKSLTNMYVFATYSPNEVGHSLVDKAKDIWTRLRPAIDRGLEAQAAQGKAG